MSDDTSRPDLPQDPPQASAEERYLKTEFLRFLVHALRSPLSVVGSATSEFAQEEGYRGAMAKMAKRNLKRVQHITEQLEWVAELEAQAVRLEPGECDLELMIREVCQAQGIADDRLTVHVPEGLPKPTADRRTLLRALDAVLDNAHRFSEHRLQVSLDVSPEAIEITVDDDGPGIAPERLPKLYDRYRSARSRGADTDLALGLSLARDYVTLQGGNLSHDASPLGGTRCRIQLPR